MANGRYDGHVQRLFSMFPVGLPGAALFLLRVCVIGMLIDSAVQSSIPGNFGLWMIVALAATSFLLLLGALTPIASLFSIFLAALCWPGWGGLRTFEFCLQALVTIALFILGPGAYSIDSKMFGRRLILPPE